MKFGAIQIPKGFQKTEELRPLIRDAAERGPGKWYDWEKSISPNGQPEPGVVTVWCSERKGQGPGKSVKAKAGDFILCSEHGGFDVAVSCSVLARMGK